MKAVSALVEVCEFPRACAIARKATRLKDVELSRSLDLLDLLGRNLKSSIRRRNARIHGGLQKHFLQIA